MFGSLDGSSAISNAKLNTTHNKTVSHDLNDCIAICPSNVVLCLLDLDLEYQKKIREERNLHNSTTFAMSLVGFCVGGSLEAGS